MRKYHNLKQQNGFTYSAIDSDELLLPSRLRHKTEVKVEVRHKPPKKNLFVPADDEHADEVVSHLFLKGWGVSRGNSGYHLS